MWVSVKFIFLSRLFSEQFLVGFNHVLSFMKGSRLFQVDFMFSKQVLSFLSFLIRFNIA